MLFLFKLNLLRTYKLQYIDLFGHQLFNFQYFFYPKQIHMFVLEFRQEDSKMSYKSVDQKLEHN